jgi:cyclase
MQEVQLHQVSRHVYARVSGRAGGSNMGFVLCEEGVVVVDTSPTPAESRRDLEALRRITEKPLLALVLTHHHSDHTFGAQGFDCEVIASAETAREMRLLGQGYVEETRRHHAHLGEDLEGVTLVCPTRTFKGGMRLGATPAVEVLRMGGHTAGLSVVHAPEERVLFASDLVFNGVHPYTKGADLARWVAALDEVLGMDVEAIVPGHGAVCGRAEVEGQRRYLQQFRERLGDLKRRGYGPEEVAAHPGLLGLPDLHRPRRLAGSVRAHWEEV